MSKPAVVAIDGPASSGKSAIGQRIARQLGYLYYDTGALYRAVTLAALRAGVDVSDEEAVARLARQLSLELTRPTASDGRQYTVLLNGKDVTWDIYSAEVDANVSVVSAHPAVRQVLLQRQREAAARGQVVMAGRDIGTVVCPQAELKLYLQATPEVRAQRRLRQLANRGVQADYEQILAQIRQRDYLDQGRAVAPLRPAEDAVVIETSFLTLEDEMKIIEGILQRLDG